MRDDTPFSRHAALVDRMAATQGIDLEESILRGQLTETERHDAILSCTGCTQPGACEHWLADHQGAEDRADPPGYCRNTALFDALKP